MSTETAQVENWKWCPEETEKRHHARALLACAKASSVPDLPRVCDRFVNQNTRLHDHVLSGYARGTSRESHPAILPPHAKATSWNQDEVDGSFTEQSRSPRGVCILQHLFSSTRTAPTFVPLLDRPSLLACLSFLPFLFRISPSSFRDSNQSKTAQQKTSGAEDGWGIESFTRASSFLLATLAVRKWGPPEILGLSSVSQSDPEESPSPGYHARPLPVTRRGRDAVQPLLSGGGGGVERGVWLRSAWDRCSAVRHLHSAERSMHFLGLREMAETDLITSSSGRPGGSCVAQIGLVRGGGDASFFSLNSDGILSLWAMSGSLRQSPARFRAFDLSMKGSEVQTQIDGLACLNSLQGGPYFVVFESSNSFGRLSSCSSSVSPEEKKENSVLCLRILNLSPCGAESSTERKKVSRLSEEGKDMLGSPHASRGETIRVAMPPHSLKNFSKPVAGSSVSHLRVHEAEAVASGGCEPSSHLWCRFQGSDDVDSEAGRGETIGPGSGSAGSAPSSFVVRQPEGLALLDLQTGKSIFGVSLGQCGTPSERNGGNGGLRTTHRALCSLPHSPACVVCLSGPERDICVVDSRWRPEGAVQRCRGASRVSSVSSQGRGFVSCGGSVDCFGSSVAVAGVEGDIRLSDLRRATSSIGGRIFDQYLPVPLEGAVKPPEEKNLQLRRVEILESACRKVSGISGLRPVLVGPSDAGVRGVCQHHQRTGRIPQEEGPSLTCGSVQTGRGLLAVPPGEAVAASVLDDNIEAVKDRDPAQRPVVSFQQGRAVSCSHWGFVSSSSSSSFLHGECEGMHSSLWESGSGVFVWRWGESKPLRSFLLDSTCSFVNNSTEEAVNNKSLQQKRPSCPPRGLPRESASSECQTEGGLLRTDLGAVSSVVLGGPAELMSHAPDARLPPPFLLTSHMRGAVVRCFSGSFGVPSARHILESASLREIPPSWWTINL